jgi:hypothetical protein
MAAAALNDPPVCGKKKKAAYEGKIAIENKK